MSSDPFEYVRAATQTHVVTTNTQALQARSPDGNVVTLAPAADHVPVHVDLVSGALTAVIGTRLHQWNIADWSERLRVDLAAETSQKSFLGCAASDRWPWWSRNRGSWC